MLTILGTIAIVIASIGIGLLLDRKFDLLPRKEKLLAAQQRPRLPGHAAGEAPATAIAASPGELEKLRRKKCDVCSGETDALADDRVTYDSRELLVVHARCRKCGLARSLYVDPQ